MNIFFSSHVKQTQGVQFQLHLSFFATYHSFSENRSYMINLNFGSFCASLGRKYQTHKTFDAEWISDFVFEKIKFQILYLKRCFFPEKKCSTWLSPFIKQSNFPVHAYMTSFI